MSGPAPVPAEAREVDLLLLSIGGHRVAVGAVAVAEIIDEAPVTIVPEAPEFLEGLVDVRGGSAPLIDLRRRMGVSFEGESQIIITRPASGGRPAALRVDKVLDLIHVRIGAIDPPPRVGGIGAAARYILGVHNHDGRPMAVLDLEAILTSEERANLDEILDKLEGRTAARVRRRGKGATPRR